MTEEITDITEEVEELPLKVEITNHQEKEKEKNPTSEDTINPWDFTLTDEEKEEMTDAQ